MLTKATLNAVILANVTELTTAVITNVAGNEISTNVGGERLGDILNDTVAAKIEKTLNVSGGSNA